MTVREGKWDCSQCRTTGIPGLTLNCPVCGDARNPLLDAGEKPYLADNARVISDAVGLRLAAVGPNWNCGNCGQANIGASESCSVCEEARGNNDDVLPVTTYVSGKDAEGKALVDAEQLDEDRVDAILRSSDKLQALEDDPVVMPSRTLSAEALPRGSVTDVQPVKTGGLRPRRSVAILAASLAGILLVGSSVSLIYANFIKTEPVDLTVQRLSWERQVEIEEFRTLTEEDWSVPSDGRIQRSFTAIHHYDRVLDHYDKETRQIGERVKSGSHSESYVCGSTTVDNGNGTFTQEDTSCTREVDDYTTVYHDETYKVPVYRQDPVYRTRYVYQVDRWLTDHFETASGASNPTWPVIPMLDAQQRVGDERRQSYDVILRDEEGRMFERSLGQKTWSHLEDDEVVHAEQNRQGSVTNIDWPAS